VTDLVWHMQTRKETALCLADYPGMKLTDSVPMVTCGRCLDVLQRSKQ
jgi:hypothetical protein